MAGGTLSTLCLQPKELIQNGTNIIDAVHQKEIKMEQLRQVFTTPDGKTFDTKAEALDYLRKPKIKTALTAVTGNNAELTEWLMANQEKVEIAFETGTIRRVTKTEHNKLSKALEALKEITGNPKISYLQENAGAILDSFRWPSVKRMDEQEKATAARNTLVAASDGNEKLAEWILANRDSVLAAYEAGVEKRQINPKAQEALAAYRLKKAAEKAGNAETPANT
jgi:hypothetical protein